MKIRVTVGRQSKSHLQHAAVSQGVLKHTGHAEPPDPEGGRGMGTEVFLLWLPAKLTHEWRDLGPLSMPLGLARDQLFKVWIDPLGVGPGNQLPGFLI